jgi:hypothetical protein
MPPDEERAIAPRRWRTVGWDGILLLAGAFALGLFLISGWP